MSKKPISEHGDDSNKQSEAGHKPSEAGNNPTGSSEPTKPSSSQPKKPSRYAHPFFQPTPQGAPQSIAALASKTKWNKSNIE